MRPLVLAACLLVGCAQTAGFVKTELTECSDSNVAIATHVVDAVHDGQASWISSVLKLVSDAIGAAPCIAAAVRQHFYTAHATIAAAALIKTGIPDPELERADRVLTILNVATVNTLAAVPEKP